MEEIGTVLFKYDNLLFAMIELIFRSTVPQEPHSPDSNKVIPLFEANLDSSAHQSHHAFEIPSAGARSNLNIAPLCYPIPPTPPTTSVTSSQTGFTVSSTPTPTPPSTTTTTTFTSNISSTSLSQSLQSSQSAQPAQPAQSAQPSQPSIGSPSLPRHEDVECSSVSSSTADSPIPHSLNLQTGATNASVHMRSSNRSQGNASQKRRLVE